jgi:hypothetical protein
MFGSGGKVFGDYRTTSQEGDDQQYLSSIAEALNQAPAQGDIIQLERKSCFTLPLTLQEQLQLQRI